MLREWILAALFAVAAVLFAVGAGFEWGVGVALMVGAVLLAVLSYLVVADDGEASSVPLVGAEGEDNVVTLPAPRRTEVTGALTPSEMTAALAEDDEVDVG